MNVKIRKPKSNEKKFFGYPEDKWARGGGRYGYRRSYGRNKTGGTVHDFRSRKELLNNTFYEEHIKEISGSGEMADAPA